MAPPKTVLNVTHQGNLYRIVTDGVTMTIRCFEHGLNKGYELDRDEVPKVIDQLIKDKLE
jgi:hypothetical protein